MEGILKIVFDKSKAHQIINIYDIYRIIEFIIIDKQLNDYISNIEIHRIGSNILASYSINKKEIFLFENVLKKMIVDINSEILVLDDFEKILYINLRIIQVIFHEVEHAIQQKYINADNFDSNIIGDSQINSCDVIYDDKLYECAPAERFAEIKSILEISSLLLYIKSTVNNLVELFDFEILKRNIRGYHYNGRMVSSPLKTYFTMIDKIFILSKYDFSVFKELDDRFYYGLDISDDEYCETAMKVISKSKKFFTNGIKIM